MILGYSVVPFTSSTTSFTDARYREKSACKRGYSSHSCPSLPSESIVHKWESQCTMGQVNCPWESTCTWVHYIPLSPYHVGQVGLSNGIPGTTWAHHIPPVRPILLYHVGQVGLSNGIPGTTWAHHIPPVRIHVS